jgi:hypothetical protein
MEAPRQRRRIRHVNDETAADLIRGLSDRSGVRRLLHALGFAGALAQTGVHVPSARAVLKSSRTTLTAWLVELNRADINPHTVRDIARTIRSADPVGHHLLIIASRRFRCIVIAADAIGAVQRYMRLEREQVRQSDIELLRDLAPQPGDEHDTAAALRIARALDRSRVSGRFFRDVVAIRDLVSLAWSGVPRRAHTDRDALALLLLSRLMFLYFLQRRGLLNGDPHFLKLMLDSWRGRPRGTSFFRCRLNTFFFGVLNRRPERRTRTARSLGTLPYLNGGLFERHRIETAHPELDLPDDTLLSVFNELLEKYRFTATDAAEADRTGADVLGVDPEMLGRIFEGLMPGDRRSRTGTFYTPADVVDRVVLHGLAEHIGSRTGCDSSAILGLLSGRPHGELRLPTDALRGCVRDLRVIDPACGSGAFLLGALSRLTALRTKLAKDASDECDPGIVRRRIVADALHGVDLLDDAALICSLRLWLALVPQCEAPADVPPLPNLDRRIRQGDALVDPLDIGSIVAGRPLDATPPASLRELVAELAPTARRYLEAGPETRAAVCRELQRLETSLARAWLDSFEARLAWQARELAARAGDLDLFGAAPSHAIVAERQLVAIRRRQAELHAFRGELNGAGRLPFFSFRIHFAEAERGFDLVFSNPPWVRSHNWPPAVRALLRERYHVCGAAGWPYVASLTQLPGAAGRQVDLSLLFLEKSLRLLAPGGTIAMILPAKLFRSLYSAGARELLLRDTRIARIEDHGLDHRAIFDADAFTAVVIASSARQGTVSAINPVHVELTRATGEPLRFDVPADELPLRPGDDRSPWLLAPADARAVFRAMQRSGVPIGEQLTIRRGAMTGANEVLVLRDVEPRIGDLARIRADGYYRAQSAPARAAYSAYVEGSAIRPVLRGADVAAWRPTVSRHVLWTPHNDDAAATAPPRLRRYLLRHRARLGSDAHAIGALHRLSPHIRGHKVVWSDLAADLRAAAVEPVVRGIMGSRVPIVPLNTVYFVPTDSLRESLLLAAYLNSLPLRTFARAIAERAKDAHFRFFAWTLAVLPLPAGWRDNAFADRLHSIAVAAHRSGSLSAEKAAALDALVARSYGMGETELAALRSLDAWMRGD